MVDCCQADSIEEYMDRAMAARELTAYRSQGPAKTTRMLLDALKAEGVQGGSLLDIGGGVGAIQHEFLQAGSPSAISVDASSGYLEAAREEAERQGHPDRLRQMHGDFVQIANEVPPADVVTLDRVICCYDDMESLVRLSAERAKVLYGVVYPTDHVLSKALVWLENIYHKLKGREFRAFVHPSAAVDTIVRSMGMSLVSARNTLLWKVVVYRRGLREQPAAAVGD